MSATKFHIHTKQQAKLNTPVTKPENGTGIGRTQIQTAFGVVLLSRFNDDVARTRINDSLNVTETLNGELALTIR